MYIAAFTKPHRMREIPRYLYKGQQIITEPRPGAFDTEFVIIESTDDRLTQDLVDRLGSGMIGAKAFEDISDAFDYGIDR